MSIQKYQLPPLYSLVPFEAAARLLNFTAAARELNVSQSAISQQIRNLEDRLGVSLFIRDTGSRQLRLTHFGKGYWHVVAKALGQIADASHELRATLERPRVTIATDQSIAWMWLMQRLPAFQRLHPEIAFRLIVSDSINDCVNEAMSLGIVHGEGRWLGYESRLLFEEEVFPVCSAEYLAAAPPLTSTEDLRNHTLLHLEDDEWHWMNWRMWLTEMGVSEPSAHSGLITNNYPLLIEAAKKNQGIALGWRHLVDDDLSSGVLVCPIESTVKTQFGYHLVWPMQHEFAYEASTLAHWLLEEVQSGGSASEALR